MIAADAVLVGKTRAKVDLHLARFFGVHITIAVIILGNQKIGSKMNGSTRLLPALKLILEDI